ncbi:MAG: M50 family metallopeptidase, partial [Anaerolineae bacterium]
MELVTRPFWVHLQQLAGEPDSGLRNLWARLQAKLDLASYRPEAAPDVIIGKLDGRDGPYYILKSPSAKTYYRLSARDHFLWERMDGSQSVKDLVVAYFMQYGAFAFGRVAQLVSALKAGRFLTDKPVSVYRRAQEQVESRRLSYQLMRAANAIMQHQFAIGGLDRLMGRLYRWGGFLLFTGPMQLLYILLSVAGVYCFSIALRGGYSLVASPSGSYLLGLVILLALQLLSILIHELAHALTVKHYGREVREAGAMIYFGFPGFFVDTTDIWLEGKRARLAVSWAGPYSGLVLAGLASVAIAVWPEFSLSGTLFRFASVSYLLVFLNLNPLLKLDGYYLLMDWLEIPMLRNRSMAFLRTGLPAKVQKLRSAAGGRAAYLGWLREVGGLSREERIFALFGALSALWTLYAIYLGVSFWQSRLSAAVSDLFAGQQGALDYLLAGVVVLVSAVFLLLMLSYPLRLVVGAVRSAAQRGVFAKPWRLAAAALFLVTVLALVVFLAPTAVAGQAVGLAALLAVVALAGRNVSIYAGSRFAPVSALIGLAGLAWLLAASVSIAMEGAPGWAAGQAMAQGLEFVALLALCSAATLLLPATGLRRLWVGLWVVGVLVLVAGAGFALYSGAGQAQSVLEGELILMGQVLLPALGLGLLLPSLFAFWRTVSGPAWTALALAFGWLMAAPLLDWSPVPAHLLLASALTLQYLALSQVRFGGERRAVAVDIDDGHRLQRAFFWTMEEVLRQITEVAGEWQARVVAESFTRQAEAARWPTRLALIEKARVRVTDRTKKSLGLIERGENYAYALNLLLGLVTSTVGVRLTRRTLQAAYDGLPWEEREIASQYLFAHVDQARALSQQFEAMHRDYAALVSRVPIFATMSREEIELLLGRLRLERHPAGKRI